MENAWLRDTGGGTWDWNWTELCGHSGGINPLNPETHDLGICFQQLCLQIPVLTLIAIISAYHCGKQNISLPRGSHYHYAITLRIFITLCLVVLPIIQAYIILTNITIPPLNEEFKSNTSIINNTLDTLQPNNNDFNFNSTNILNTIRNGINYTENFIKSVFSSDSIKTTHSPILLLNSQEHIPEFTKQPHIPELTKATAAKPIDYLVAGTEGLAWVVHLCFIISLRKRNNCNVRGPLLIRVLIILLTVISILLLRSHYNNTSIDDVLPNLSLGFSITTVTLLILYILTLVPMNIRSQSTIFPCEVGEHTALLNTPTSSYVHFPGEQDTIYLGSVMEGATLGSKLLFYWVTPLMEKGVQGLLIHTDVLFDLPENLTTSAITQKINKHSKVPVQTLTNGTEDIIANERILQQDTTVVQNKLTLLSLLHKCFGWQFYAVGILKFIADCSSFMGPILLSRLISFIEDKNEPISYGYLYASLIIISSLIGAFCNAHFTFWMSMVGLKIRSTIVTLIYRKILYSSNVHLHQQFNFGEIVNFMTTDNDRLVNSCPSFHTFWSIPLELIVTLYLLYQQIGISFLAGVTFAVILIPINKIIANKIGILSTKLMEYKDKRVRMMGETLRGITTIKLNVWEEHFSRNILKLREKEIKYLRGRKYLDALCVYFWATTPVLISILTFATYVLLGNELNAKVVFTSMALLNMLIGPLNAFPWVLNGLTEAWVSVKRVQRMLNLPDMDISSYYMESPPGIDIMFKNVTTVIGQNNDSVEISNVKDATKPSSSNAETKKNVTFEDNNTFNLRDINITVQKGQLVGIMGEVGSGKSLLLDAILAEISKVNGTIALNNINKGFGYVKQNPWLQYGTIRENILFGKSYDHNKYKSILEACALADDVNSLREGDLTAIGEAGNALSGGQKTRISLARAVYADKDIYLLDDVLATLDTKIAAHVFQHVILGLLKNKTRILCTHQTQYLIHADIVIEMLNGKIIKMGKPGDVIPDVEDYLLSNESIGVDFNNKSNNILSNESNQLGNLEEFAEHNEEHIERGNLKFKVYTSYITAVGRYLAISILISMILMQSSKNMTDLWLSYWVTSTNISSLNSTIKPLSQKLEYYLSSSTVQDNNYYLTVYGLLALFNSVFTLIRAFIFAYGGIQAATFIHKQLLKTVIKATNRLFDVEPLGRIINRFSSDTYTIDDTLPFITNILFAQLFGLVATIIVTSYGLPWIFLILAPLVPVYHWIQNHYRLTSRELKRLSSTALSPLYTHFNETLCGLSSIRAFRAVSRFVEENELLLEARVALLAGVSIIAVLQHQYDIADPGLIGLAITYALSITSLLSGVVNAFTETERELIAVERVGRYLDVIPEETISGDNPPFAWPSQGVVEFNNVVLQYRQVFKIMHSIPSLKEVSFITRPAEKIGIVGRTGAGKTSIFTSLFRLVEISSGSILIDNVNIQTLQLNALRSRLAIIPQRPFLFSGTIRENVDPLNQYPDLHIYKALEKCKVHSLVYRLGGLGAQLDEGGSNLSAGQRQLLCLVRAILHNAKIVCIDEATANVDQETDKFIQSTIKSSFRSATVITIAHRIRTIMHCDRVLVMGDGEVLEFDEPNLLIQNSDSYFYNLANQEFSDKE
ncbi:hypothetical protein M0802_006362 [Mischocyttarus mexicanus]|nr:hypothetical protein M0802_006362 [Mischocyttarus mexicanus]